MKKFSTYLVLAVLGVAAVGCSDDSDDNTAAPSKTSMLTAKTWRISDSKISGVSIFSLLDDCDKDDDLKFNASKTLTYTANTKCDPSEPTTQSGTWELLSNDTQLRFTDPDGTLRTVTVTTLNSTTLTVSGTEDFGGQQVPAELTFTAR